MCEPKYHIAVQFRNWNVCTTHQSNLRMTNHTFYIYKKTHKCNFAEKEES